MLPVHMNEGSFVAPPSEWPAVEPTALAPGAVRTESTLRTPQLLQHREPPLRSSDNLLLGDPWEGCEELAAEDLTEWLLTFAKHQQPGARLDVKEAQVQRLRDVVDAMLGTPRLAAGWDGAVLKRTESDKLSMLTASTRSSLGCGPGVPSTATSTPRSSSSSAVWPSADEPGASAPPGQPPAWGGQLRGWGAPPPRPLGGSSGSGGLAGFGAAGPVPSGGGGLSAGGGTAGRLPNSTGPAGSRATAAEKRPASFGPLVGQRTGHGSHGVIEEDVEFLLRSLWLQ